MGGDTSGDVRLSEAQFRGAFAISKWLHQLGGEAGSKARVDVELEGMMVVRSSFAVGALVLLLGGCASETELSSSSTAVQVAKALPPPDSTVVAISTAPYHVVPGDELTISVFGAPDLDKTGLVDGAGDFAVPLAGTVHVAGQTPEEISASIADKLRGNYLKNPRIS